MVFYTCTLFRCAVFRHTIIYRKSLALWKCPNATALGRARTTGALPLSTPKYVTFNRVYSQYSKFEPPNPACTQFESVYRGISILRNGMAELELA